MLGACSWFTDFKQQPKIDPWESAADTIPPRGNPQMSVPVFGSYAPGFEFGRVGTPGALDSMSTIANPHPADARSLENGRKYYQINCAPCHGVKADGQGAVLKYGLPAPSLIAMPIPRSDGYIFGIIRNGRGLMPSYNRIEEPDRWDIINYVRGLQGRYQVVAAPLGLPGETGDKVPGATQMGPTRPAPYFKRVGAQAWPGDTRSHERGADTSAAVTVPAAPGAAQPNAPTTAPGAQPAAPARPDTTKKGATP